jgi:hypothetical protein
VEDPLPKIRGYNAQQLPHRFFGKVTKSPSIESDLTMLSSGK